MEAWHSAYIKMLVDIQNTPAAPVAQLREAWVNHAIRLGSQPWYPVALAFQAVDDPLAERLMILARTTQPVPLFYHLEEPECLFSAWWKTECVDAMVMLLWLAWRWGVQPKTCAKVLGKCTWLPTEQLTCDRMRTLLLVPPSLEEFVEGRERAQRVSRNDW